MSRAASPQTNPALAAGHSCQPLRNLHAIGAFSFVCVLSLVQAQRQIQNKKQPTVAGCLMLAEKVGFVRRDEAEASIDGIGASRIGAIEICRGLRAV